MSQELIDNLITVIDECEMARYHPPAVARPRIDSIQPGLLGNQRHGGDKTKQPLMMTRRSTILSIIAAIVAIMAMPARLTASHAIIEEADSAYTRDDFSLAATLYTQAIDSLGHRPSCTINSATHITDSDVRAWP